MQTYFPWYTAPSNDSGLSHFLFLLIMNLIKTGHTLKEKKSVEIWLLYGSGNKKKKQPKENLLCNNHDLEIIHLHKSKSLLHISRLHLDIHRQVPIPAQSLLHQWDCVSNTIAEKPWKVMPHSPERHFLIPPLYLGLGCFHLLCSLDSFQLPENGSASLPSKEH